MVIALLIVVGGIALALIGANACMPSGHDVRRDLERVRLEREKRDRAVADEMHDSALAWRGKWQEDHLT